MILTNSYGRPWTSEAFGTSRGKLRAQAGIDGLTFHDLGGTAVVLIGTCPNRVEIEIFKRL